MIIWNGWRLIAAISLLGTPVYGLAGESPPPSIGILLYLAEWETDEQGRLLDPMEVPPDEHAAPDTRRNSDLVVRPDAPTGDRQ